MTDDLLPTAKPKEIGDHKPSEYLMRFAFGAGISLAAGLIGMKFGPVVGGVFLGFPAILPASLTLIEKKAGRQQAAIDSEGAILGAIAMVAFAFAIAMWVTSWGVVTAVLVALAGWLVVATGLYALAVGVLGREPAPP
jgi:Protein of unknown function (DUF3147)